MGKTCEILALKRKVGLPLPSDPDTLHADAIALSFKSKAENREISFSQSLK
jgi:hypothetical protein